MYLSLVGVLTAKWWGRKQSVVPLYTKQTARGILADLNETNLKNIYMFSVHYV